MVLLQPYLYGSYWLINVYSVIQYIIGSVPSILKRMSYCHMTTHEQLVVNARMVLVRIVEPLTSYRLSGVIDCILSCI